MHDSCFRVIDSWNSWVISTIASSWVLINQSIHRSRWCFFPGSRIPLHRFCRADIADPTAEWPSRQSSRGALRFPWFPLRKGSGWNGCQGGMERSSVFQDKCLTDSLRILKEGSMLKWSYIYNNYIHFPFVCFLSTLILSNSDRISSVSLWRRRDLQRCVLACHWLAGVTGSGKCRKCQVYLEVKQVDEPIIKTWRRYKCCKFRSLFFSTIAIAAIKLNPNHIMCLDHSRQLI